MKNKVNLQIFCSQGTETGIEWLSFRFIHMFNLMSWQVTRKSGFPTSGFKNGGKGGVGSWTHWRWQRFHGGTLTCHLDESTRKSNSAKKSAPWMRQSTLARRNKNWKRRLPNWRGSNLEPQAFVGQPLAIRRQGPVGAADKWWRNTEHEAPVSTKNSRFDIVSWRLTCNLPTGRPFSSSSSCQLWSFSGSCRAGLRTKTLVKIAVYGTSWTWSQVLMGRRTVILVMGLFMVLKTTWRGCSSSRKGVSCICSTSIPELTRL